MSIMITCKTCHTSKSETEFYTIKRPSGKIDLRPKCKTCYKQHTVKNRQDRHLDPAKKKEDNELNRLWYKKNNAYSASKNAKRRAAKLQQTPVWAELKQIRKLYEKAQELGLTIDHIVPIKGKLVSGLHCLANLQLLTLAENSAKGNRYES